MRFRLYTSLFLVAILFNCQVQRLDRDQKQVLKSKWEIREITEGAVWKYYHFDSLFDSRQNITVIDVDLNNENIKIKIPHIDFSFKETSRLGKEEGAFAAVNGSFFNTTTGGSVVYFYEKGELVEQTKKDLPEYLDNAGFSLDREGNVSIIKKPVEGWQALANPYTVLSSGPLLVYDGEPLYQVQEKFNTNRHPRTAVGITDDNHLIAVVVDGRSSQSHGMTIEELATLMEMLECSTAMNLDGGGSSTAWVNDQPFNGIVNFPCDNKVFDRKGERGVANAIVFIKK
jgi:exopolysaccharide biosynthesis protein